MSNATSIPPGLSLKKEHIGPGALDGLLQLEDLTEVDWVAGPYPPGTDMGGQLRPEGFQIMTGATVGDDGDDQLGEHPSVFEPASEGSHPVATVLTEPMKSLVGTFAGNPNEHGLVANCFTATLLALGLTADPAFVSEADFRKILAERFETFDPRTTEVQPGDVIAVYDEGSNSLIHAMAALEEGAVFTKMNAFPTTPFMVESLEQLVSRLAAGEFFFGNPEMGLAPRLVGYRLKAEIP
jgi:hypothetical protein